MTDLLRRFALVAVAVTIGLAPLAHELCQVSCVKPAASTPQTAAAHEHCAQAAIDDQGSNVKMSAARVADCRSQATDAVWTTVFVKVPAPAPAILLQNDNSLRIGVHAFVRASSPPPSAVSVPSRTQLRV